MKSSFKQEDVEFLLKDLTDVVTPITIEEKRKMKEQGEDVSGVITEEFKMENGYFDICFENTEMYAKQTALAVGNLAEQLYKIRGNNFILVSLLRAGTTIGILVKRYLKNKYGIDIYHYSIHVPQDANQSEFKYILERHKPQEIQFIDGWTGKGSATNKIKKIVEQIEGMSGDLAVISDSINITKFCGIREDIAIPQSPFNACITGLVGMPVVLNEEDFAGATYLKDLEKIDVTNWYIDLIEKYFDYEKSNADNYNENPVPVTEKEDFCRYYGIEMSKFNPGINEAARALLRRKVEKLVVKDKNDFQIIQIKKLAELKSIPIEEYNFKYYKAATISND